MSERWFANDGSKGGNSDGDAWWVHVGGTWVSLAELGTEHQERGCVVAAAGIGDTTFFSGGDCLPWDTTSRDLWILSTDGLAE